jgi:hypothetical protein
MWTARGMATTVFVFADLIASDFERQLCINGMNAPLSLLIAEVKPPATKRGVTDAGPARLSCAASNNVAVLRAIIVRGDRLKDFAAALGIMRQWRPACYSGLCIPC